MMGDLYKKNTCLDFPKGGNEALVEALVRGIEKHPGGILALEIFFIFKSRLDFSTDNHRFFTTDLESQMFIVYFPCYNWL